MVIGSHSGSCPATKAQVQAGGTQTKHSSSLLQVQPSELHGHSIQLQGILVLEDPPWIFRNRCLCCWVGLLTQGRSLLSFSVPLWLPTQLTRMSKALELPSAVLCSRVESRPHPCDLPVAYSLRASHSCRRGRQPDHRLSLH